MSDNVAWGLAVIMFFIFGFGLGRLWQARKQDNTRYAGDIQIAEDDIGRQIYSLSLNCEPEELLYQDKVIFHIVGNRT